MDFLNFGPIAKSDGDSRQAGSIKAKFLFTSDELKRSPSILAGFMYKEEQQRLQTGCAVIRRIGERLNELQREAVKVSQLCIAVSIIQLRRFFTIHSLRNFDPIDVGAAALFMSTKSEECPRRLEFVVRAWFRIRYEMEVEKPAPVVTISKVECEKFGDYIVWLENVILQSIGFNFTINIPHPIVIQLANVHRPSDKKFHESVFWLTTDALHMTDWAVRYNAPVIGCAAFYMAMIWKDPGFLFPAPVNGKEWFQRMDSTITFDHLQEMTKEFLDVWKSFDKTNQFTMSQFDHKTRPFILDHGLPPANSSALATPPSSSSQSTSVRTDPETSSCWDNSMITLPPPPPPPSFVRAPYNQTPTLAAFAPPSSQFTHLPR